MRSVQISKRQLTARFDQRGRGDVDKTSEREGESGKREYAGLIKILPERCDT